MDAFPASPGPPTRLERRASSPSRGWLFFLLGSCAAIGIFFLLPNSGYEQAVFYAGIGAAAAVALVVGARRQLTSPLLRLPWYLFAVGLSSFAVGDALFGYYSLTGAEPFPSAADGFYLAAYPVLFAGFVLLVLRLGKVETRFALVDALIVTAALALLQWVFLMEPMAIGESGSTRLILLAYPAMDVLLAAALARLLLTPVWRSPAFVLLAAAVLLQLVGDELYLAMSSSYVEGSWLDSTWLLSYAAWGAAALHPSARRLAQPSHAGVPALGRMRLGLLAAALLSIPIVLAYERYTGLELYIVSAGGALLSMLVLVRIATLVRTLEALRIRERDARAAAEAAHEQLAEHNAELRKLDRLKDEFIGMVSHDLRTPLTAIRGYVELLLDGEGGSVSDEQRRFLAIVERNAGRLEGLVDDLLFSARLRAGSLELTLEDTDLAEMARQCVEANEPRARGLGIALTAHAGRPAPVVGDDGRLGQVLDNLVSNSLKFTPEGGQVNIRVEAEGERVVVEVADTGIGIPLADQRHVFDQFFRAPGALARQVPGTGLGLHIAKAIVDAHGGTMSVTSEEGRGTVFRAVFPRALAEAAA